MKKLLFFLLILFFTNGFAQNKAIPDVTYQLDLCRPNGSGILIYRQNAHETKEKMYVRQNETVSFKVININPMRYEVSIDNKSISNHDDGSAFIDLLDKIGKKSEKGTFIDNSTVAVDTLKELSTLFYTIDKLKQLELRLIGLDCIDGEAELKGIAGLYQEFIDAKNFLLTVKKLSPSKNESLPSLKEDSLKTAKLNTFITTKGDTTAAGGQRIRDTEAKFRDFSRLQQTSYMTLPIPANNNIDYIQFDISKTLKGTDKTEKVTYEVWVRGGWKIDFSASLWGTGLIDEKYTTKDIQIDTVTRKQILKQDEGTFAFALGAQVNCMWRCGVSKVRPGFSFGISVSDETNFQLMPGFTILFGKDPRIGFTGGIAFGKVERLDAAYELGGYYSGESGNVPTVDKFSYAPFVGFTYNLSKPKDQKKEDDKQ